MADEPAGTAPSAIRVTSPAFVDGAPVPVRFTCRGANLSPPLRWTGVPAGAAAVAVVVADPDAPGGTYIHWVVLDADPATAGVGEGQVPARARQARNSAGHARYDGPCPPSGTHRYRFVVYALSRRTGLASGADLQEALDAIDRLATARGTLVGTVAR